MTREKIKYYLYIHNKTKQLIEESNKKIIEYKNECITKNKKPPNYRFGGLIFG